MIMAVMVSASLPLRCQIQLFEGQRYPVHRYSLFSRAHNHRTSLTCSIRIPTMEYFSEPSKVKMCVDHFKERLWESFPASVKEFPWKKAEDIVLQRLLVLGEKALKWSLITLFVISSLSDVILSISRNRELMIPMGLFIGCALADFLKETSQELVRGTKEGGLSWNLLGIGSFFLLLKFISVNFTIQGRLLLSHVGNGGFMQVLWLWNKLQEDRARDRGDEKENSPLLDDASMAIDDGTEY